MKNLLKRLKDRVRAVAAGKKLSKPAATTRTRPVEEAKNVYPLW